MKVCIGVLAFAPAALMWSLLIVALAPFIQICLQFVEVSIDLLAKRDSVELIQQGLVQTLYEAKGLRAFGLRATVIDVLHGQVQLILVPLRVATVLGAPIREHPQERNLVRVKERHHPIVEQVSSRDGGLAVIELGERQCAVSIFEALLIDATHTLEIADVEGILRPTIARLFALELDLSASWSVLAFSIAATCASVRITPACATFAASALSRFFMLSKSWRSHTEPHPRR
jgi:hypothetical protein